MLNGRCRMHGGMSPGRPIIHGRYSLKHRQSLAHKAQAFLDDPEPGNLLSELALMRALMQDYLERFPDGVALPAADVFRLLDMLETVSRLVERISRILNQTALTQAEIQFLQGRLADIIVTYIDDSDKRLECLDEIEASFGVPIPDSRAGTTSLVSIG